MHEDAQVNPAHGRVGLQVIIRSVSHAHNLNPAHPIQENLGIPAVCGIMSHLICLVLPEAQLVRGYAHSQEELVGAGYVVSQGLVGHNAPLHSFSEGHLLLYSLLLGLLRVELHADVSDLREAGMALVPGIDENLSLSLSELPQPDHALAGRDLISKRLANLHSGKRQGIAEVAKQSRKVDEHALRGLRAQVACHLVSRPDHGLEHEIELINLRELSSALRAAYLIVHDAFVNLLVAECIGHLNDVLDEVICPVNLLALLAARERIGKAAQVP